jgi:hypothetical protein
VVATSIATATAVAASDTDDSLKPANTSFTFSGGNIVLSTTINGLFFKFICTVGMTVKTRASGLAADVTNGPAFTHCADNFFGTDTVTTSGTWTLTLLDDASETQAEPNSGDQLAINIPAGGAKFTSSALPGCTVTTGASSPASSSFNDQSSATFSNANVNVTGNGCTVSTPAHLSGTFTSNINVGDLTT